MSENESNPRVELESLLALVLDGAATENQQQRVARLLSTHEELRAGFVETMRLHAALAWQFLPGRPLSLEELQTFSRAEELLGEGAAAPKNDVSGEPPSIADVAKHLSIPSDAAGNSIFRLPRSWGAGPLFLLVLFISCAAMAFGHWGLSKSNDIAWLVNARDCRWADEAAPNRELTPGRMLVLKGGLAEIHFQDGAELVLQGPAKLELLTANSARLHHGKLSAHVPEQARGFQIHSPTGRIVDLGTDFGFAVDEEGRSKVVVFQGQVDAYSNRDGGRPLNLLRDQAARIDMRGITLEPRGATPSKSEFVRAIEPAPVIVPRVRQLDFRQPQEGKIRDATGQPIGLSDRLPTTGSFYGGGNDPNIRLNREAGQLEVTTTESDINNAHQLDIGEYFGVRLADLGFTGTEDFEITITLLDLPDLGTFDQIGLFAGRDTGRNIRGGLIGHSEQPGKATQFLVNHEYVIDKHQQFVGVSPQQSDIVLTLRRSNNRYSLISENRTTGASVAVTTTHPAFLDDVKDMHVGLFGANTRTQESRKMVIKDFKVTVWTVSNGHAASSDQDDTSN